MTGIKPKTLADFDSELAAEHIKGQWLIDPLLERLAGGPRPAGQAHIWRWRDIEARLDEACDVLAEGLTARRSLALMNPALPGGTTHTLTAGIQMLNPGEQAWAHRHTMSAIRFVIRGGPGLSTVVDGEACQMDDYDLVLTPSWTWHDHHNDTTGNPVWLDALDIGLIMSLNTGFYETYGEERQALRPSQGEYLSQRAGLVRPVWEQRKERLAPFRYAWSDVEPVLLSMADQEGSPYDGVVLEYVNPMTGGPTTPTLSCWVQMLRPHEQTQSHRHTSSSIYFVVRGEGTTRVGDEEISWGQHDTFVVPNWLEHSFRNSSASSEAILFSVNDIPTLRALGLYYEQPETSLGTAPWPAVPARPGTTGGR
ncbi:MAG: gentisate 1,2-dioxygenase / 1-hydroxy-2-naphthoate dioxygenase [Frankiales bacterium]|nr:gentisate 1,2-dioxygenase / 1-hydroxy-2-naphthoate dioxygenase [Frankiales bacterium]